MAAISSPNGGTLAIKRLQYDRAHPRWHERLASAGRPFACVEVTVADANDQPLPAGETGEILCRGDVVMPVIKVRDFNFTSLSDAV